MMNSQTFFLLPILLFIGSTRGYDSYESCIVSQPDGSCPDFSCCIDPNIDFTYEKVEGRYYQYLVNPYFFGTEYKCGTFEFSQPNSNSFYMELEEWHNTTEIYRKTTGVITYNCSGKFLVKYTNIEIPLNFKTILLRDDIWCAMECNEAGFLTKEGAGTYFYCGTRQRYPSSKQRRTVQKKLKECGVSLDKVIYPNKNCACRNL